MKLVHVSFFLFFRNKKKKTSLGLFAQTAKDQRSQCIVRVHAQNPHSAPVASAYEQRSPYGQGPRRGLHVGHCWRPGLMLSPRHQLRAQPQAHQPFDPLKSKPPAQTQSNLNLIMP
jgi:hypothetical protein